MEWVVINEVLWMVDHSNVLTEVEETILDVQGITLFNGETKACVTAITHVLDDETECMSVLPKMTVIVPQDPSKAFKESLTFSMMQRQIDAGDDTGG